MLRELDVADSNCWGGVVPRAGVQTWTSFGPSGVKLLTPGPPFGLIWASVVNICSCVLSLFKNGSICRGGSIEDLANPAVESYAPEAPGIHGGISGILPLPSTVSSIADSTAGQATASDSAINRLALGMSVGCVFCCLRLLVKVVFCS